MKKRFFLSVIYLVLLFSIGAMSIYGWYVGGINTSRVTISSANVSSEITVFQGNDFDKDGIFDWLEESMYNEIEPDEDGIIHINITDFKPTDVLTFKIHVVNAGDVDGYPFFIVDELMKSNIGNALSVSVCKLEENTVPYIMEDEKHMINQLIDPDGIVYYGNDDNKILHSIDENVADFIIQIKFESFNEVSNAYTYEQYNELQAKDLNCILFSFVLSSDTNLEQ